MMNISVKLFLILTVIQRGCRLNGYFFFNSGGHFVQGLMMNISVKLFLILTVIQRGCRLNGYFFFNSGGHFVQRSGIILAILVVDKALSSCGIFFN